jgi:shikimate kinase
MNEAGGGFQRGLSLIGYRGAGKSSVGREVAKLTDRQFIDLDDSIADATGKSASDYFAANPDAFRDLEQRLLASVVASNPGSVIATGGGAALRVENRGVLRAHGMVVWLRTPPATLAERLRDDLNQRPTLTGRGTIEEIEEVLAARIPIYAECCHAAVDTDGRGLGDIALEVVLHLQRFLAE